MREEVDSLRITEGSIVELQLQTETSMPLWAHQVPKRNEQIGQIGNAQDCTRVRGIGKISIKNTVCSVRKGQH